MSVLMPEAGDDAQELSKTSTSTSERIALRCSLAMPMIICPQTIRAATDDNSVTRPMPVRRRNSTDVVLDRSGQRFRGERGKAFH